MKQTFDYLENVAFAATVCDKECIYRSTNKEDICLIPAGFENNNYQSAATTTAPRTLPGNP